MYSFKEKSRILKELINPEYGEADLTLLRRLAPGDSLISSAENSPGRNAEAILFKLLDLTTREEIRLNRRNLETNSRDDTDTDSLEFKNDETSVTSKNPQNSEPEKDTTSVTGEKKSSRKRKSTQAFVGKDSAKTKTSK